MCGMGRTENRLIPGGLFPVKNVACFKAAHVLSQKVPRCLPSICFFKKSFFFKLPTPVLRCLLKQELSGKMFQGASLFPSFHVGNLVAK